MYSLRKPSRVNYLHLNGGMDKGIKRKGKKHHRNIQSTTHGYIISTREKIVHYLFWSYFVLCILNIIFIIMV